MLGTLRGAVLRDWQGAEACTLPLYKDKGHKKDYTNYTDMMVGMILCLILSTIASHKINVLLS